MILLLLILRNKIGTFLQQNGYTESHIQKGFVEGMSGTIEHLSHLSYTMKEAKRKQRSLTVTLIDLRNAFGLVRHDLIMSTLRFHHVPPEIIDMIKHIYTGFHTAIATDSFTTDYIHVGKGVLQGDCYSTWQLTHSYKGSKVCSSSNLAINSSNISPLVTGTSSQTMLQL